MFVLFQLYYKYLTGVHVASLVDISKYKTEYKWSETIVPNTPLTEIACTKLSMKIKYNNGKDWLLNNVIRANRSLKGNVK